MAFAYQEAPKKKSESYKLAQYHKHKQTKESKTAEDSVKAVSLAHSFIETNIAFEDKKSISESKSACDSNFDCHHHHYHTHIHYNSINMSYGIVNNYEFRICVSNFRDSIEELAKALNGIQKHELLDLLRCTKEIEEIAEKHTAENSKNGLPLEDSLKQPISQIKESTGKFLGNLWDPNSKLHKAVKKVNSIGKALYNFAERYDKIAKFVPLSLPFISEPIKQLLEILFK